MATAEGLQTLRGRPLDVAVAAPRSRWREGWRRFSRNRLAVLGLFIVATWVVVGLLAPWVAPYSYRDTDLDASRQMPSSAHWLGTDNLGRDQLSRLIWAGRTALIVAPLSTLVAFSLGLLFGALAGYLGGWVEALIMRLADVLFAFPSILFALLLASTSKPGLESVMESVPTLRPLVRSGYAEFIIVILALSVVSWPGLARLVRGQVLTTKNSAYVEAARAGGTPTALIIRRHILPNIMAPVIVVLSMGMGGAIVLESSLSFLGIGIQPPIPSWGNMINEGYFSGLWRQPIAPYVVWAPGLIVSLLVFAFSFIGDGLNEALNPHLDTGAQ